MTKILTAPESEDPYNNRTFFRPSMTPSTTPLPGELQVFTPFPCLASIAAAYDRLGRPALAPPTEKTSHECSVFRGIVDRIVLIFAGNEIDEADMDSLSLLPAPFTFEVRLARKKRTFTVKGKVITIPAQYSIRHRETGTTIRSVGTSFKVSMNPSRLLFGRNDRVGEVSLMDLGAILDAMLEMMLPATLERISLGQHTVVAGNVSSLYASRFFPCVCELELAVDAWIPDHLSGPVILRLYGATSKSPRSGNRGKNIYSNFVIGKDMAETVYLTKKRSRGQPGCSQKLYLKALEINRTNERLTPEQRLPPGRMVRFEVTLKGPEAIRKALLAANMDVRPSVNSGITMAHGAGSRLFISGGGPKHRWSPVQCCQITYTGLHSIVARFMHQIEASSQPIRPIADPKDAHHATKKAKIQQTQLALKDLEAIRRLNPEDISKAFRKRGDIRRGRALWTGRNQMFGRSPELNRYDSEANPYRDPPATTLFNLLWHEESFNFMTIGRQTAVE